MQLGSNIIRNKQKMNSLEIYINIYKNKQKIKENEKLNCTRETNV